MNNIKLFESKQIRSVWNEADQKWYFSIADVIQALTDTINVKDYIKKMRKRDPELASNWGTFCPPLEMMAPDGKRRKTQCANAENVLRIIQSIPSTKAEPFKRWLARVGYERLEEIENPELAAKRMPSPKAEPIKSKLFSRNAATTQRKAETKSLWVKQENGFPVSRFSSRRRVNNCF